MTEMPTGRFEVLRKTDTIELLRQTYSGGIVVKKSPGTVRGGIAKKTKPGRIGAGRKLNRVDGVWISNALQAYRAISKTNNGCDSQEWHLESANVRAIAAVRIWNRRIVERAREPGATLIG